MRGEKDRQLARVTLRACRAPNDCRLAFLYAISLWQTTIPRLAKPIRCIQATCSPRCTTWYYYRAKERVSINNANRTQVAVRPGPLVIWLAWRAKSAGFVCLFGLTKTPTRKVGRQAVRQAGDDEDHQLASSLRAQTHVEPLQSLGRLTASRFGRQRREERLAICDLCRAP